nr:hypothetical protein [Streptomyces antioxidans]
MGQIVHWLVYTCRYGTRGQEDQAGVGEAVVGQPLLQQAQRLDGGAVRRVGG